MDMAGAQAMRLTDTPLQAHHNAQSLSSGLNCWTHSLGVDLRCSADMNGLAVQILSVMPTPKDKCLPGLKLLKGAHLQDILLKCLVYGWPEALLETIAVEAKEAVEPLKMILFRLPPGSRSKIFEQSCIEVVLQKTTPEVI